MHLPFLLTCLFINFFHFFSIIHHLCPEKKKKKTMHSHRLSCYFVNLVYCLHFLFILSIFYYEIYFTRDSILTKGVLKKKKKFKTLDLHYIWVEMSIVIEGVNYVMFCFGLRAILCNSILFLLCSYKKYLSQSKTLLKEEENSAQHNSNRWDIRQKF